MTRSRTGAEFFAGIGLMRIGLEQAGWRVVWANDIDPKKHEMYRVQFDGDTAHFELGDIHSLSVENLPMVALAVASFPCNDLSLAGGRDGLEGKQSGAFWGFVRVLDELGSRRPKMIMLENVPGFLTSKDGRDLERACMKLNELGYAVDALMIDALSFVPQSRLRMFIIGMRKGRCTQLRDQGVFLQSECRPPALASFIFTHPQITWAIRPLPKLPKRTANLTDIIENIPDTSPLWWNAGRAQYLLDQMSPRHLKTANELMSKSDIGYGTVFRRVRNGKSMAELRVDGVAGCLRTPRGGSGRQILFKAGRNEYSVRLLTPRECARLMGVDKYRITVPPNQALFGFGDAVCVPVIRWIANNYLNPAWRENYEEREAIKQEGQQIAAQV